MATRPTWWMAARGAATPVTDSVREVAKWVRDISELL
jgi:hypothetical protein